MGIESSSRKPKGRDIREKEQKRKKEEDRFEKIALLSERTDLECPECQKQLRILTKWFLADEDEIWIYCPNCFAADLLQKIATFDLADYYSKFKDNYDKKMKEEAGIISKAYARYREMPWPLFKRDFVHYLNNKVLIMPYKDFKAEFRKALFYET